MARAFGVGIETSPCCEDAVPMGVVELGTSSSQPSSCCESCLPLSVYQEPACEGLRVTMVCLEVLSREKRRLKDAMVTECCGINVCCKMMEGCGVARPTGGVRAIVRPTKTAITVSPRAAS
jgi:hypothetical protein